jgi:hypothetical protein
MSEFEDKFELLAEDYGLGLILEQNDITEMEVLLLLYFMGRLDLADYFYTVLDVSDED